MARTKDSYRVTGRTPEELARELNFLFARIADRMDKIEGIRGTASIDSDLDMNSNRVTELGAAQDDTDGLRKSQADLTGTSQSLGTVTVTNLTVRGDVRVYDADDNLIHSME